MRYDTYVGGEIVITPPVPADTIAGSAFAAETVTDAGRQVFLLADPDRRATVILPAGAEGYTRDPEDIAGHLNEIINLVGDGHVYTGELRCEGDRHDDIWRVRVVDGQAVEEYAEVVYPADFVVPEGPAVVFSSDAARTWLTEPVEQVNGTGLVRGHDFGVDVDELYDPARGDSPADWVDQMVAAFNQREAPHVWRNASGVSVEVVETVDPDGLPDGGAVVVVDLAGVRLASRWLEADHLTGYEYDHDRRATKPQLDAAIEALSTTAGVVNAVVERHRVARAAGAIAVATRTGQVRLGHVNYHTPGLPASDAVAGRWTFAVAAGADFPTAWDASVAEFRTDPQMWELAHQAGHGLNYGDLIDHGQHILARHGLELLPEPAAESITVDHDTPLVDCGRR
jgi:hypothetical protein